MILIAQCESVRATAGSSLSLILRVPIFGNKVTTFSKHQAILKLRNSALHVSGDITHCVCCLG